MPIATYQSKETHMEEMRPFTPVAVSQEADLGIPAGGDPVTRHYAAVLSHLEADARTFASLCPAHRKDTATQEDVRQIQQARNLLASASKVLWG